VQQTSEQNKQADRVFYFWCRKNTHHVPKSKRLAICNNPNQTSQGHSLADMIKPWQNPLKMAEPEVLR
jgi:hypothetical protein